MELDAARIAGQLGGQQVAPVDVVLGADAVTEHCPPNSTGCAYRGGPVYAEFRSFGHELVHAPVIAELERVSLPWRAKFLYVADLDGDGTIEVVVAPMPVTAIAVFGLGGHAPNHLHTLDVPFEGIDIATGDRDGDGIDEIYVLDPRDERIIEIAL